MSSRPSYMRNKDNTGGIIKGNSGLKELCLKYKFQIKIYIIWQRDIKIL